MNNEHISKEAIEAFEPETKVGLLATLNEDGLPHISLLTSLQAKDRTELIFGQFCEGSSKKHVSNNPRCGFLVMTMKRELWRGKATWSKSASEGQDYVDYNNKPMFRYNSYFGIHTVHYLDLVTISNKLGLSLAGIGAGTLAASALGQVPWPTGQLSSLNAWTRSHFSSPKTLKFVSYVDDDGYPVIVPVVPCSALGDSRLLLFPTVYRKELKRIPKGASLAVFALNLEMESCMVRGIFRGFYGLPPFGPGLIDVDWVYNSMPPTPGQIYPPVPLRPVTSF